MIKVKGFIKILLGCLIFASCDKEIDPIFRQYMREFVENISSYSKGINPDFLIIPQNGPELVTENGEENGTPQLVYLATIDGVGREDLFYGYNDDNHPTPGEEIAYMVPFLKVCTDHDKVVLTTDYCWDKARVDAAIKQNDDYGFISFPAPSRELDRIPTYPSPIHNENDSDIESIQQVKNFLYLINPGNYSSKADFISKVSLTNYDLIIMDLFFEDGTPFTFQETEQLKVKLNGASRLVVCYLSIGEAEDYRYYWRNSWKPGSPKWIEKENRKWKGNYKVRYWDNEWQAIIYGNDDSYIKKILDAGFDGAYLDIIDAFEYFE